MQMLVTFDHIKTFYNILVQKIKGSRGNWNQNNPNADDYIKNRPFYSEVKEENLILVNNLTSDSNNWPKCNFVPGQFYNITWNGILYSDVLCYTDGEYNILGGVDNYPFYINDDGGDGLYIDSQDDAWTVSISCSVIQEVVHKLDKKFIDIPDSDELAQVAFDGDYNSLINTPTIYTDVVRYGPTQYLTTAQQNTARTNIDVYSKGEVIANYVQMKNNTIALPLSSNWQSVTYGDSKFVAVCCGSDIAAYSEDGITWIQTYLPLSSHWYSVTYGNGKFVSICNRSRAAAYSEDGITWVRTNLPFEGGWYSVTYGSGKFVAVCNSDNRAAYSEDGITWVQTYLPFGGSWSAVTYGNGKFVAVCYSDNRAAYSEDGITWIQTDLPLSSNWQSVTYGNGKFVATCNGSKDAVYSEDGITWVRTNLSLGGSLTYGNGKFVSICRGNNHAAYSEDGITWVQTYLPLTASWSAVTYGKGKFVAVCYGSNIVAYSKNGITWTRTYKIPIQNGVRITPEQLGFKEPDLTGYATIEQLDNIVGRKGSGEGAEFFNAFTNVASGDYSHAEGCNTTASGDYSHAEGYSTTASGKSQHVQGEYNIVDPVNGEFGRGKYVHIVGNGTSEDALSNAYTIDWNGVGWFQGGLQIGGNAQDDGAKNVLVEGDAIPVPQTATVGQTLVIKSVDENGKPIEWELINLEDKIREIMSAYIDEDI